MTGFHGRRLALALCLATTAMVLPDLARAQQVTPAPDAATTGNPSANPASEIIVTGSRIPRIAKEGPAPVTVFTAQSIRDSGYATVPDILRALTSNGGETQSQQSFSGASFTPGAQQVDLRGLGPNHTLVLVNGRRIADFPLPYQGRSNFTEPSRRPDRPDRSAQRQRLGDLRIGRDRRRDQLQAGKSG